MTFGDIWFRKAHARMASCMQEGRGAGDGERCGPLTMLRLAMMLSSLLCGSTAFHLGLPAHSASPYRRGLAAAQPYMSLVLTEENVQAVLEECQVELGTLFGSNPQSLKVGITGAVEFVELDGPTVVVKLTGRFWHKRSTVLERVESFVLERIPECVGVDIDNPDDLDDADALGDPADLLMGKDRL